MLVGNRDDGSFGISDCANSRDTVGHAGDVSNKEGINGNGGVDNSIFT